MIRIIVPCYSRPEFLAVGLPLLKSQVANHDVSIRFSLDYGHDRRYLEVIRSVMRGSQCAYDIHYMPLTGYTVGKQSYHLLSQYAVAARNPNYHLIIMLEEDVFVSSGFLDWHETAHQNRDLFCAVASKNNNRQSDIPREDYLAFGEYQGLGVSFKPKIIMQYLIPHIVDSYFSDPIRYCRQQFPSSTILPLFAEQDGLISRIQATSGLPILFAGQPTAFHVGFYGKARNKRLKRVLSYADKLKMVSEVCFKQDLLDEVSGGAKDCRACPSV